MNLVLANLHAAASGKRDEKHSQKIQEKSDKKASHGEPEDYYSGLMPDKGKIVLEKDMKLTLADIEEDKKTV